MAFPNVAMNSHGCVAKDKKGINPFKIMKNMYFFHVEGSLLSEDI